MISRISFAEGNDVNEYRTEILEFAVRWAPYNGGDDEILPTFGLSIPEYYRRLVALLETPEAGSIDRRTREHLRIRCGRRLRADNERSRLCL
uniref:DUF3263 domain-containing protein n=1 Tax=Rhodococcus zopfii TaxID=43772 RepID=A0ABU3WSY5_9NOCA|nr:DUF3263 domain-containing protein [Rhodococcus zopfii]